MSSSYSNPRGKPAASPLGVGLSEEARRAMNSAFDALSSWRNEAAAATERNSNIVFERMSQAAKAMGWPSEFVDMTRQQLQQASRMQLQIMDQMMDVWEQQMKSPGSPIEMPKFGSSSQFGSVFPGAFAGMGGTAQPFPFFPGFDMSNMAANPFQFWMQAAEMWQKSWSQAFESWMEMQKNGWSNPSGR
jgi:hypothetical protein